jgi:hypothetical protein
MILPEIEANKPSLLASMVSLATATETLAISDKSGLPSLVQSYQMQSGINTNPINALPDDLRMRDSQLLRVTTV